MSANSFLQNLLGELADLHASAQEVLADDDMRKSIIRDLGGDASSTARFPPSTLDSVQAYRSSSEPGLEALLAAIQDIRSFHEALSSFAEALDLGAGAIVEESYALILDVLGWNLIRQRYPFLYFVMQIFSFAEDITSPFADPGLKEWRPSDYKRLPLPSTLNRLISGGFELKGYLGSGTDGPTRARRLSDAIFFSSLIGLKASKQLSKIPGDNIIYGLDILPGVVPSDPPTPAADEAQERMFTINFVDTNQKAIDAGTEDDSQQNNLVASLALVPESQGGPGLVRLVRRWRRAFVAAVRSLVPDRRTAVLRRGQHADRSASPVPGPDEHRRFPLRVRVRGPRRSCGQQQAVQPGDRDQHGHHRRPGAHRRRADAGGGAVPLSDARRDRDAQPELVRQLHREDPAEGRAARGLRRRRRLRSEARQVLRRHDSFRRHRQHAEAHALRRSPGQPPPLPPLPPETGPGFGLTIPIGKSLGPLTIHNLQLRFGSEEVDGKSTYLIQAASSISAKIGPVMARVDRAGLKFGVRIPDREKGETGNLKFANIDVGAVLPNGVSLAIDAKGVVTGGGFLYHDKVQEVYAGVMQLSIKERITVKAFGLIATKMPDGSKGYSLIVFITAEDFQPIPVGMGANLLGIGGMIAINRTFDEEAMRAGLRNKTLGTLLFPKDPIRQAPEIIRNLITTFPAEEGCYLIGVLLKLGWFSPTLVYLDIAIIIELGKRLRLIVLGMISALLPTKQNDLVRLNMDALGLIDMGALSVAIDAVLVDSRLAQKFVLTGEMALRASMLPGRRNFVMAVGGFNPRFAPPENFPTLKRITIALASGNNPRLTCEAYFAITSNTVQFGARAELYAAAFGFSIEGDVGFDVLIHLLPFHLIADFKASVQLKRGSRSLFKLSVSGTLEGPRPLRISGKASFEIFWCDFTIRFDKTLISGDKPPLPPAVDVLGELRRVLTAPDAWSTQIAQNRQHGVSLRKIAAGTTLVLDPLGNLVVKQTIVPLNTSRDLDTFGGAPVAGARRFKLQASIEGVTQDVNTVQDAFAPGQFFDMTDDEKLASPSFEDMDAGAIFGSDAIVIDEGASLFAELEYETIIIDEEGLATNEVEDRYPLVPHRLFEQVRFSAVGMAPIRNIGAARFRNTGVAAAVTMRTGQFVIASVTDGIVPPTAKPATFAETQATLTRLNRGVAGEALWQILPMHETAG